MKNRQVIYLTIIILIVVSLAAAIGIIAFQLGQQSTQVNNDEAASLTSTPFPSATPTATTLPPPIITNTPTSMPSATSTPNPTNSPTATASPTATPTSTFTPTPTPIVVITHVNSLGRLETTQFAMQTVIDLENEPSNLWEEIFGTDRLMLIAEGEVVAGIDLNKVNPEDIQVQGTSVNITLPPPEILYSRIDNERSYIYERKTGLFHPIDKTLESRARLLAEQSLVDWAIERNIHEKAAQSGQVRIENLLRSLGFTQITIQFKEETL